MDCSIDRPLNVGAHLDQPDKNFSGRLKGCEMSRIKTAHKPGLNEHKHLGED